MRCLVAFVSSMRSSGSDALDTWELTINLDLSQIRFFGSQRGTPTPSRSKQFRMIPNTLSASSIRIRPAVFIASPICPAPTLGQTYGTSIRVAHHPQMGGQYPLRRCSRWMRKAVLNSRLHLVGDCRGGDFSTS